MKVIYRKSIEDQIREAIIQAGGPEAIAKVILTPGEWKRMEEENPSIRCEDHYLQYRPKLQHGWWQIAGVTVVCPADSV